MNISKELKQFKARVLKHKAKNKYDCIKYLFTHEQILDLTPILLYSILFETLGIPETKNAYDAVRRWQLRYKEKNPRIRSSPVREIKKSMPQNLELEKSKDEIKLSFSNPVEKIDKPLINILEK